MNVVELSEYFKNNTPTKPKQHIQVCINDNLIVYNYTERQASNTDRQCILVMGMVKVVDLSGWTIKEGRVTDDFDYTQSGDEFIDLPVLQSVPEDITRNRQHYLHPHIRCCRSITPRDWTWEGQWLTYKAASRVPSGGFLMYANGSYWADVSQSWFTEDEVKSAHMSFNNKLYNSLRCCTDRQVFAENYLRSIYELLIRSLSKRICDLIVYYYLDSRSIDDYSQHQEDIADSLRVLQNPLESGPLPL